jgi:aryl-alcohol dehydrogenase-like predicted oxidoreductase
MALVSGHATREGTEIYRRRFDGRVAPGHFRPAEGLTWSSIGIGTYLGNPDSRTDDVVAEAVCRAIAGGINVIDSAINYRFERGEKSVGAALRRLTEGGGAAREEIVVCTKGGYLPNPAGAKWFAETYVGRDGIAAGDLVGGAHCMHPAYLRGELERSRRNLGVATIDVYYVHNPESQVGKVDEKTFHARLRAAFAMLEGAVAEGAVRAYGIASWNAFRVKEGERGYVSLARAKTLALEVAGGRDHFRYVQLPLNLALPEAAATPTQRIDGGAVLAAIPAANALGLQVVTSGSIGQGRLGALPAALAARLGSDLASDAQRALQFTRGAPGVLTALVGMKDPRHVEENLALCAVPPLDPGAFDALFRS